MRASSIGKLLFYSQEKFLVMDIEIEPDDAPRACEATIQSPLTIPSHTPKTSSERQLRGTFNEDSELYDRCRPRYPAAVFDDLVTLARIGPQSRVLEIGCGTGQATVPIARLGCNIVAVELGASLAAVARRNLSRFPNVEIVVSAFETWPLPTQSFNLVVAATSFHWIDEAVRMVRAADALEEGGTLAVISTHHINGGTEAFFTDVQRIYELFGLAPEPGMRLPTASDIPKDTIEFVESKRFGSVTIRRYEWEATYSTREYLDLLLTYSNHRMLPKEIKEEFLSSVGKLIDHKYQGRVTKRYMTQMALASRLPIQLVLHKDGPRVRS
jgi:SAM-dependent methyltransferase